MEPLIQPDEPIRIPVTDVFDLHSVPPRDVKAVVEEYLCEARKLGVPGPCESCMAAASACSAKWCGGCLPRTEFVADFRDAPAEAGGWGATVVTLRGEQPGETRADE